MASTNLPENRPTLADRIRRYVDVLPRLAEKRNQWYARKSRAVARASMGLPRDKASKVHSRWEKRDNRASALEYRVRRRLGVLVLDFLGREVPDLMTIDDRDVPPAVLRVGGQLVIVAWSDDNPPVVSLVPADVATLD